ncbi:SpoIIE family protein phosphatase [Algoriphagus aestuariicola]|jgi:serine phosphatase RsbU (regulator of sigma subunit)|uniref:SpoIIE family protein phosphatase n=1 Tax=Algoriphagus aestuariicola TaxID=1852016 RepID=A0ABS3BV53_9BACT|nr:GAF domain-containing SpoIIE family protein phosphatase [Algoriphagus aestuariicola]MBN7802714.1 SpoIIE family protein phosphatase [Algoriphagus aestuariicola]
MVKLPSIHIGKLSLLLAILVWLALLFVDLVRLFGMINEIESGISTEITWILEILFFFTLYGFYNYSVGKNIQSDFLNLLWRAASTGIFATGMALLTELFYVSMGDSKLATEPFLKNFFYHVNFALTTIFLISSALLWKHLILYQKNKQVVKQWQTFEFAMLLAMFFVFFNKNNFDYSFLFGMVILFVITVVLSSNLKWIPYLTFKEKWKSLLFLFLILACTGYLFRRMLAFNTAEPFQVNLTDNLFLMALFGFIFTYALFSFLVTLFNLPTSSVFEQKLTEAINFQRLSQSIQPDDNEEQVLDILLDSCMSASYSDGAWIEISPDGQNEGINQLRFLDEATKEEISEMIKNQKSAIGWATSDRPEMLQPLLVRLEHPRYESTLLVPLVINKIAIGRMVLCKEVRDGFNKEMVNIISTFVRQACIAVENHRLLNQAIQNERYQEELKIAQRVQKALLPSQLDHPDQYEICAFSNAADEVGGDYYDTYKVDENRYVMIIGDVSGKGTSAAFHMAQMKGVFQSLIQLNLSPAQFMIKANSALGKCLERNHFITASIFQINISERQICHARAGHIPTLLYKATEGKSEYLFFDGLGLGILRNKQYENHVQEKTFTYEPGDILVLITDGIVEAKNQKGQQFGFERIKSLVEIHHLKSPKEIQNQLIDALHVFVGGDGMIEDDYSMMVVKFQQPNN